MSFPSGDCATARELALPLAQPRSEAPHRQLRADVAGAAFGGLVRHLSKIRGGHERARFSRGQDGGGRHREGTTVFLESCF